jgi:hypothetical protein
MGVTQSWGCELAQDDEARTGMQQSVEAAMVNLGSTLRKSTAHTALGTKQLLAELELGNDDELYTSELREQLASAEAFADGQAGGRGKYLAAAKSMQKRWQLFLAVADIDKATEPSVQMAKQFAVFLFRTRQRRSKIGRLGMGDSIAEMAQYVLAQVCYR